MINDADGHWLAGIVDGEGCFSLSLSRGGPQKTYRRIRFVFQVAMRADDLPVLLEIQRILEVGFVGRVGKSPSNSKPQMAFRVNSVQGITRVIEVFRHYLLRSKKKKDFLLWAEAFEEYQAVVRAPICAAVVRKHRRVRPADGRKVLKIAQIPETLFQNLLNRNAAIREGRKYRDPDPALLTFVHGPRHDHQTEIH